MEIALRVNESNTLRYSFIATRAAVALGQAANSQEMTAGARAALQAADTFLLDILAAPKFHSDHLLAPRQEQLDAFNCALEIILSRRQEFNISSVKDLLELLTAVHEAIESALHGVASTDFTRTNQALTFFRALGDSLLGELKDFETSGNLFR